MKKILQGKGIVSGYAKGPALLTEKPMNFTAAFTKPQNMLFPWLYSQVNDHHHELYRRKIKGKVFIYPATIGSTGTGLMLLEIIYHNQGPAGIIVENADTLMVSGPILAGVWFGKGIPVVEYRDKNIYQLIRENDMVEINGSTGEITVI